MVTAYFVLAGLGVALWLPILARFYKSWTGRRNPISLAICAAILLLIWSSVAGGWLVTGSVNTCLVVVVSAGLSAAVAGYAHLAFYWSTKKFNSERTKPKE